MKQKSSQVEWLSHQPEPVRKQVVDYSMCVFFFLITQFGYFGDYKDLS